MKQTLKVAVKGYYKHLYLYTFKNRIYVGFAFNRTLLNEVKSMRGARWHPAGELPPDVVATLGVNKAWSVDFCERNLTNINILAGDDPFKFYFEPYDLISEPPRTRTDGKICDPFPHQLDMSSHQLAYRKVITSAEMGTGKTYAVILTMERVENPECREFWYISTGSGIAATQYELRLWRTKVVPMLFTYSELVTLVRANPEIRVPKMIVFDESAAIKNITAQRTQAAMFIADRMQREVDDPVIIEMSGAPQPQSPADWWSQVEVIAPGFLKEGDQAKFARRLSFNEPGHNNAYLKRVSWRDDPNKCHECGIHIEQHGDIQDHRWKKSINEVELLGKRLRGPVKTVFKKDVLKFLPDKFYREIECPPTPGTLRAAKMIAGRTIPTIQKLTLLRMLSDGFKYTEVASDQKKLCPSCMGLGEIEDYCPDADDIIKMVCPQCKGELAVDMMTRGTQFNKCPKDDALKGLLEECEDHGRIIQYAGFTGSVDRCVELTLSEGWDVIRVDSRKWHFFGPNAGLLTKDNCLEQYQTNQRDFPRLAFIAQGGSAGTGLNLTASEMIVYYSNDFNANNRIQSEDRTHRPGCTGAMIVDLIHLPSDRVVLTSIKKKKQLQKIVLDASIFNEPPAPMKPRLWG